eukprot:s643_g1.t1
MCFLLLPLVALESAEYGRHASGILASIDAHLEHLSDKMDQFHMDMLAAIPSPRSGSLAPSGRNSNATGSSFSSWRGSAARKEIGLQMIPSDRFEQKPTVTIMDSAGSADAWLATGWI